MPVVLPALKGAFDLMMALVLGVSVMLSPSNITMDGVNDVAKDIGLNREEELKVINNEIDDLLWDYNDNTKDVVEEWLDENKYKYIKGLDRDDLWEINNDALEDFMDKFHEWEDNLSYETYQHIYDQLPEDAQKRVDRRDTTNDKQKQIIREYLEELIQRDLDKHENERQGNEDPKSNDKE